VGEPSFGKNTVQVWGRLENNGGVRITISRWFTPEHNSVAPDGIQPDIRAARTAETPPEEDPILDAALAFLEDQPVADGVGGPAVPSASPSPSLRCRQRSALSPQDRSASIPANERRWCAGE
jgi:carboxyl-terminal processing protease